MRILRYGPHGKDTSVADVKEMFLSGEGCLCDMVPMEKILRYLMERKCSFRQPHFGGLEFVSGFKELDSCRTLSSSGLIN